MYYYLRRILGIFMILSLMLGVGASLAACGDDDDATAAPAAFTNPTTGEKCAAWVNTPHEVDDSGLRAYDFPIPTDQPVRSPGMSIGDYLMLHALFDYGMGHHGYYYSEPYYRNYISPAYARYPGYTAYGYGHMPMPRYSNNTIYRTTVINHVDTKYATQEKAAERDPKLSTYKTANGKTYTGTTVPRKAFSGTNVPAKKIGLAGDAPIGKTTTPKTSNGKSSTSSSGNGKSSTSSGSLSRSGGRRK